MTTAIALSKDEIVALLVDYRNAEAEGAKVFRGWAAVSQHPSLRGALRVMELREHAHAQLLDQRLRELGNQSAYEQKFGEFLDKVCSAAVSDAEKLSEFLRIAPPEDVVGQLSAMADRMSDDRESQGLVRAIIEDERATLWALRTYSQELGSHQSAAALQTGR